MTEGFDGPTDAVGGMGRVGMMFLTGRPDGPLARWTGGPRPGRPAPGRRHRPAVGPAGPTGAGRSTRPDGRAAAIAGLRRRGQVSCGGSSRLMRSADGWIAATMARPSDWELVPAFLELASPVPDGAWSNVEAVRVRAEGAELRARAELLRPSPGRAGRAPASARRRHEGHDGRRGRRRRDQLRRIGPAAPPVASAAGLVVADLSALWAGPLVGRLLAGAGARVIKIESVPGPTGRGEAIRVLRGDERDKASVALDFGDADQRLVLAGIVSRADVVISASRPRALDQLGLDVEAMVGEGRPRGVAHDLRLRERRGRHPTGWRSATMPPQPAVWWGGTGPRPASAATPSPTR